MNEGGSGGEPKPELGIFVNPSNSETAPEDTREIPSSQESIGNKPIARPSAVPSPVSVVADQTQPQQPLLDEPVSTSKSAIVDTSSLQAVDQDRIEKSWIDAVKILSTKTKSDPFSQNKEMSKVKADYIHKRFNKTIKTNDTGAP